jgi:hypothetical protein
MQKNAKSAMRMQNANAMQKKCDVMNFDKSANANAMQKRFRTTIRVDWG